MALALAAAACGRPANHAPQVQITDSAGVWLVRNGERGLVADSIVSDLREELRIGAADGPEAYQFQQPLGVDVDAGSGELYVLDAGFKSVRVYSSSGEVLREFGQEGDGPGEFRYPTELRLVGDTVVIYDMRLGRISLLAKDGSFLTGYPARREDRYRYQLVGRGVGRWIAAGNAISQFDFAGKTSDGPYRDTTRFHAFDAEQGTLGEPFLEQPGGRLFFVYIPTMDASGTFPELTPALFEPRPAYGVSGKGRIYLADGRAYRVDVHDASGRLLRRITRAHEPRSITDRDLDAYHARVLAQLQQSESPQSRRQLDAYHEQRLRLPRVEAKPALGRLIVAAGGAFLAERPDLAADAFAEAAAAPWDLFDAAGRFLGTLRFPERFLPMALTEWTVTGVRLDELDVPYVVRYGIGSPGELSARLREAT